MTKIQWCENLTLAQINLEAEQIQELAKLAVKMAKILKPLTDTEKRTGKPILSDSNYRRVFEIERLRHPDIYYSFTNGETRIEINKNRSGYEVRIANGREPRPNEEIKSGWTTTETYETLEAAKKRYEREVIEYVSETMV